jgi:ribosomal subunit interface protein
MITRIEKSGINLELDEGLKKYIDKKIGHLDHYMPAPARKTVHAEVKLRADLGNRGGDKYSCEVVLHLPGGQVTAQETTLTLFAAVDIVEAKLKAQLKKYKEAHIEHIRERRSHFFKRLRTGLFGRRNEQDNSES